MSCELDPLGDDEIAALRAEIALWERDGGIPLDLITRLSDLSGSPGRNPQGILMRGLEAIRVVDCHGYALRGIRVGIALANDAGDPCAPELWIASWPLNPVEFIGPVLRANDIPEAMLAAESLVDSWRVGFDDSE